jgi:NAD(P)-dependent dehydrogenase (short-subunit alcohol dehydrogenase family)
MDTGLQDKVVLITGATRNHGKATALAFAEEGANLLICTRKSIDLLRETARLATDRGSKVIAKQCDVTDEAQVSDLLQSGLSEFGRIDVLINNAGWRVHGDVIKLDMEEWQAALDVNVHALFRTCKAVIPGMAERRWGRIINSGKLIHARHPGSGYVEDGDSIHSAIAQEYGEHSHHGQPYRPLGDNS